MHFLITALGSYGDVHPMVGLGAALAGRGHRVSLVANPYFADVVRSAGVELVPLGTREEYLELARHPDLWHPVRGQQLVFTYSGRYLPQLYDLLMNHYLPGETVFAAHPLDFASRIAGKKLNAAVASVNLAPSMFISKYESPKFAHGMWANWVPPWLKALQIWLIDRIALVHILGPAVNNLRREVGLPPVKRFFTQFWHDTDLVLGLFPDWFAAPQADWPPRLKLVGFPLWDGGASEELSPELRAFLDQDEKPIVFTPGSANADAAGFFTAAVEACRQLGKRGILLTKFTEQLPRRLPIGVRHFGFVPLSKLLPKAAAFVNHGGIGSCAQGLAAGVPQLIRPLAFDQFDNSLRLQRLGVAAELSLRRFDGKSAAATLDKLIASPQVATKCRDCAARCNGVTSLSGACDALESIESAPH